MRFLRAALVTVVALGTVWFLAGVVAPGYFRPVIGPGGGGVVTSEMAQIKHTVDQYRLTFGKMPESLDDLRHPPDNDPILEKDPIDPWGHAYILVLLDGSDYGIQSLGADGKPGGQGENADLSYKESVQRRADAAK